MLRALSRLCRILPTIAAILFAVVAGAPVLLFILCLIAWHLPGMMWSQYKWKDSLVRQGRYRNPKVVPSEIVGGTLIVDNPTLGWRVLQCWWTPERVREITPLAIPTEAEREVHVRSSPESLDMPFDRWVHTRCLDPNSGAAVLLATRRGDRFAAKCIQRSPGIDVVRTWSGPIGWPLKAKEDA